MKHIPVAMFQSPTDQPCPLANTFDDSNIFDGPGLTSSSVPPPIEDLMETWATPTPTLTLYLFLGDPEPEFFWRNQHCPQSV